MIRHTMIRHSLSKLAKGAVFGSMVAAASMAAHAADGTLGATSNVDMNVQVTIPSLIKIHSVSNVDLGTYSVGTAPSATSNFCVWGNVNTYTMTITSANPSGTSEPQMTDGSEFVPYDVYFDDNGAATAASDAVTSGSVLAPATPYATTGGTITGNCANASVFISVPEANLQAVSAGAYNDTMTLLVAPI